MTVKQKKKLIEVLLPQATNVDRAREKPVHYGDFT